MKCIDPEKHREWRRRRRSVDVQETVCNPNRIKSLAALTIETSASSAFSSPQISWARSRYPTRARSARLSQASIEGIDLATAHNVLDRVIEKPAALRLPDSRVQLLDKSYDLDSLFFIEAGRLEPEARGLLRLRQACGANGSDDSCHQELDEHLTRLLRFVQEKSKSSPRLIVFFCMLRLAKAYSRRFPKQLEF